MTNRLNFFTKRHNFLNLGQILALTNSTLKTDADLNSQIHDVNTLENANQNEISFLSSSQYFNIFEQSSAGFCLVDEKTAAKSQKTDTIQIINPNPYFAYSQIAQEFYQEKSPKFYPQNIAPTAQIGQNCIIAPSANIGDEVSIGNNCIIHPNAVIANNCTIGDNAIIGPNSTISFANIGSNCKIYQGAQIGQDGFGFAHHQGVNHKIIQIGTVQIADNVEIGANSCVDRGAINDTIIGQGTKIDNLVQIAHNVEIGQGTVIAGGAAIAGSAKVGNFVQIGGKSSISGHITLNDGAKVAGMSGVIRDVPPMQAVAGIPSVPITQWHRINASLMKMTKR